MNCECIDHTLFMRSILVATDMPICSSHCQWSFLIKLNRPRRNASHNVSPLVAFRQSVNKKRNGSSCDTHRVLLASQKLTLTNMKKRLKEITHRGEKRGLFAH